MNKDEYTHRHTHTIDSVLERWWTVKEREVRRKLKKKHEPV